MSNLVTVDDVATYMDIVFSNIQEDSAQFVLDGLEDELETYLGRPITVRSFTEEYIVPNNHTGTPLGSFWSTTGYGNSYLGEAPSIIQPYVLYLSKTPLVSVTSITLTGPEVGSTAQALNEGEHYIRRKHGIDIPRAYANDRINITYTAGIDGTNIPNMILTVLRAASRELQNNHDDVVGLKDLNTRNVAPLDTGFTEQELTRFKRYRRANVGLGLG